MRWRETELLAARLMRIKNKSAISIKFNAGLRPYFAIARHGGGRRTAYCLVLIAASAAIRTTAFAQGEDQGRQNFLLNCAQCHGADAKGTGPRRAALHTKPADLTLLAKNNGGIFDAGAIYQLIDGRTPGSRAHLSADMPIWGCRHPSPPAAKRRLSKHYRPPPAELPPAVERRDNASTWQSLLDLSCDSEQTIEDRILSIIGYLSRIQAP